MREDDDPKKRASGEGYHLKESEIMAGTAEFRDGAFAFITEGTVALRELGNYAVAPPIPNGESAITALAPGAGLKKIYGATSGKKSHLFFYDPSPAAEHVVDIGILGEDAECRILAADTGGVLHGIVNPGGRIFRYDPRGEFSVIWRYEVKPTDMNDIIDRTASMFGRTKKEIAVNRSLAEDLWAVDCDQGQMEQVFMNLYVNAWQAMSGGGELYLETSNVLLGDDPAISYRIKPGRYVKVSITDTGTGMDEKTRERIFDPFFTTKAMGRGTGLGLAMVYGIIKGHGGMIDVTSEPRQGTTFEIYLPATEKAINKEIIAARKILTGTETILLVDDEQMVLEVTRELLESLGYRVHAAGGGQEAIAVYMEKRKEIDLVILDMIMPGISGGETFDRLKEINPNIRVLLSSGYSINGRAQEILERGCNGFLQKPFQLEKLSRKVREVLGE